MRPYHRSSSGTWTFGLVMRAPEQRLETPIRSHQLWASFRPWCRIYTVMENLENHGIWMTDFQAWRSHVRSHGKWKYALKRWHCSPTCKMWYSQLCSDAYAMDQCVRARLDTKRSWNFLILLWKSYGAQTLLITYAEFLHLDIFLQSLWSNECRISQLVWKKDSWAGSQFVLQLTPKWQWCK